MKRERILLIVGTAVMLLSLIPVVLFCTNTRIDPQVRMTYEVASEPQDEDMALLLQMLNGGSGATAP